MVSTRDSESRDPGSTPGRTFYFPKFNLTEAHTKKDPTPVRFELTRAEPNRFLIYRLNHSATVSLAVVGGLCSFKMKPH